MTPSTLMHQHQNNIGKSRNFSIGKEILVKICVLTVKTQTVPAWLSACLLSGSGESGRAGDAAAPAPPPPQPGMLRCGSQLLTMMTCDGGRGQVRAQWSTSLMIANRHLINSATLAVIDSNCAIPLPQSRGPDPLTPSPCSLPHRLGMTLHRHLTGVL